MNPLLKLKFGDKVRVNKYSLIYTSESGKRESRGRMKHKTLTGLVIRKRFKIEFSQKFRWYSAWNSYNNEIFDFVVGDHPHYKTKVKLLK